MKYRIKNFEYRTKNQRHGSFRSKRRNELLPSVLPHERYGNKTYAENIDFDLLFEIGQLPSPKRQPFFKRALRWLGGLVSAITGAFIAIGAFLWRTAKKVFRVLIPKRDKVQRISFYLGAFSSAVCIALLTLATVLLGLFGGFLAPYDELTIPSVVGESYAELETELDESYQLLVSYENSDDIPAGVIISQKPDAGVVRKIYQNGGSCSLSVTVSIGKSYYSVGNFSGKDARTSLLELQNNGVAVKRVYEYSTTVDKDIIISTTPAPDAKLYEGETLTVKMSLGKKITTVKIPDLYGLSEAQASSILEARGLKLGNITYKTSTVGAGKVIEQALSPYSTVPLGSSVDISVSIGTSASQKKVPDLYGLTVYEARLKLSEVGLVVGEIYSVSSGAPKGTVITQTPLPNTPITSSITSVDIYISS